jgi:DNA-binding NarL/FixJ family response regulator
MTAMQQTLLIADDHPLIRIGMKTQLEQLGRFRILEAWDQKSLHEAVRGERAIDLALLDLVMPGSTDPQWLHRFCETYPDLPIMVVTAQDLASHAQALGRYPNVRGLVDKSRSAADLRAIVDLALAGVRVWPELADRGGLAAPRAGEHQPRSAAQQLAGRQRDVALLIAEGMTNREVAERLGLTEGTVKNYVKEIFRAVGVSNRTQLALCFGRGIDPA